MKPGFGMFPGQISSGYSGPVQQQGHQPQLVPYPMMSDQQFMASMAPLINAGQAQVQGLPEIHPRSMHSLGGSRKSNRSNTSAVSRTSSNFDSQLSMMSINSQPASIPGRSQRILINKKQPFSASNVAKRCFQRGKSSNKVGGSGSVTGVSSLSTASSFSSFAKASLR